jgi:hypothetical protein
VTVFFVLNSVVTRWLLSGFVRLFATRNYVVGGKGLSVPQNREAVMPLPAEHAARRLTDRFKLARDAPICEGKLFDDIGYLGDTMCTKAILEGTYEFLPEMDWHTRLLCEEAHRIFSLKSTEEISNYVSSDDFQYFWKHCDEFIQSSYSHIHFGHYKAIAHDCYLSALEAAKLSLAASTGIPMDRWGSALTVLLEKEFGNIYLDKMRASCLLEADFNFMRAVDIWGPPPEIGTRPHLALRFFKIRNYTAKQVK